MAVAQCPNCNAPLRPGAHFCSRCGKSLPISEPVCINCGSKIRPEAKFCPNCGKSTTVKQEPVMAQAPLQQTLAGATPAQPFQKPAPVVETPHIEPLPVAQVLPYEQPSPPPVVRKSNKRLWIIIAAAVLVIVLLAVVMFSGVLDPPVESTVPTPNAAATLTAAAPINP